MTGSIAHWNFFFHDLRQSANTCVLLYEDKLVKYTSWFGNRAVLFRHKKGISIPDKYVHENPKYHIGETRTSVGSAIMVAHIMGCEKIILVGIDCCRQNGLRYFWQYRDSKFKTPYRDDKVPIDKYCKFKYRGRVTDIDLIDINRSWNIFGNDVNKKCDVYNASEISILNVFQKINLEIFLNEL